MAAPHPDEEEAVVEQVVELSQALLYRLSAGVRQVQVLAQRRAPLAREEHTLGIGAVVQERDTWAAYVTAQVHHLCHQVWGVGEEIMVKLRFFLFSLFFFHGSRL